MPDSSLRSAAAAVVVDPILGMAWSWFGPSSPYRVILSDHPEFLLADNTDEASSSHASSLTAAIRPWMATLSTTTATDGGGGAVSDSMRRLAHDVGLDGNLVVHGNPPHAPPPRSLPLGRLLDRLHQADAELHALGTSAAVQWSRWNEFLDVPVLRALLALLTVDPTTDLLWSMGAHLRPGFTVTSIHVINDVPGIDAWLELVQWPQPFQTLTMALRQKLASWIRALARDPHIVSNASEARTVLETAVIHGRGDLAIQWLSSLCPWFDPEVAALATLEHAWCADGGGDELRALVHYLLTVKRVDPAEPNQWAIRVAVQWGWDDVVSDLVDHYRRAVEYDHVGVVRALLRHPLVNPNEYIESDRAVLLALHSDRTDMLDVLLRDSRFNPATPQRGVHPMLSTLPSPWVGQTTSPDFYKTRASIRGTNSAD